MILGGDSGFLLKRKKTDMFYRFSTYNNEFV